MEHFANFPCELCQELIPIDLDISDAETMITCATCGETFKLGSLLSIAVNHLIQIAMDQYWGSDLVSFSTPVEIGVKEYLDTVLKNTLDLENSIDIIVTRVEDQLEIKLVSKKGQTLMGA